jgi:hypothetical protein
MTRMKTSISIPVPETKKTDKTGSHIHLYVPRETSTLTNELPEESDQFRFLQVTCLANLKGSVVIFWVKFRLGGSPSPSIFHLGRLLYQCLGSFVLVVLLLFYTLPSYFFLRDLPKRHMLGVHLAFHWLFHSS